MNTKLTLLLSTKKRNNRMVETILKTRVKKFWFVTGFFFQSLIVISQSDNSLKLYIDDKFLQKIDSIVYHQNQLCLTAVSSLEINDSLNNVMKVYVGRNRYQFDLSELMPLEIYCESRELKLSFIRKKIHFTSYYCYRLTDIGFVERSK
jgi:hypothetical protein